VDDGVVDAVLRQRAEPRCGLLPLALLVEREVDLVELVRQLRERDERVVVQRRRRQVLQDADDAQRDS